MKPIKINPKTAIKRIRKAFNKGILGIQTGKMICRYQYDDGRVCVIGAALTKKQRESTEITNRNGASFSSLLHGKIVSLSGDKSRFLHLQDIHDGGCHSTGEWRKEAIIKLDNEITRLEKLYA